MLVSESDTSIRFAISCSVVRPFTSSLTVSKLVTPQRQVASYNYSSEVFSKLHSPTRTMKLIPLFLTVPLAVSSLFATSVSAQREDCTWVIQGKLEESDSRLRDTNAPYDIHTFRAEGGEQIFIEAESDYFNSEIALYQITDGNVFTLIDSDQTGTDWQLFSAWIYEDGDYAVRITSINYSYPPGQVPDRKFGYYTIQLSPFVCS